MKRSVAVAPDVPTRPLRQVVRDLAGLSRWDLACNLGYLAVAWALIVSVIGLFAARPSPVTFVIAFVVVAARQQALLNVEHDCTHGIFVAGKRWNDRVAVGLCASQCGSPYHAARARHLAHHRLLATDGDPDGELHGGADKMTPGGLVRHFAVGLVGGYALSVLFSKPERDADPTARMLDGRNIVVAQLILFGLLTLAFGWWAYPLLWLAPLVTLTAGAHLLRNFAEHAIVGNEEDDHADRLISIRSNPLERFVVAPFNMNYHSEHHLFPFVPARKLPELQRRLASREEIPSRLFRGSYLGALAHYVRGLPSRQGG